MILFGLAPVGLLDDLNQLRIVQLRSAQLEMDNGFSDERRFLYLKRLDGIQPRMIVVGLPEKVPRGQISSLGSSCLTPPRVSQFIRHPAEIFSRLAVPGPGVHKAEDLRRIRREHIHDQQPVIKIKGCVPCIQRPQQPGSHVQLMVKPLPAFHRAIAALSHLLRCAAGQTPVVPFGLGSTDLYVIFGLHQAVNHIRFDRRLASLF